MTCDTARILLLFYRPGNTQDLAAEDVAALESHLATCPTCAATIDLQTSADGAIGRAFRQVTVPGDLKGRLQSRTAAQAGKLWRNKWLTRTVVAAAVAVGGLIGWGTHMATRPTLDTFAVATQTEMVFDQPERAAREWMKAEGLPQPLPEDFDYGHLKSLHYEKVQGEFVPVLEFRNTHGFARVYLIRPGQLAGKDATETQNSTVTVRLYKDRPAAGWTVMILHTGTGIQPFLRVPPPQG